MATKKAKLETYGPRSMPLVRTPGMSDADWDKTTLEFDDTLRRMRKKITYQTRFKRCPDCGATNLDNPKLQFGSVSGLCMPCSDKSADAFLASLKGGR